MPTTTPLTTTLSDSNPDDKTKFCGQIVSNGLVFFFFGSFHISFSYAAQNTMTTWGHNFGWSMGGLG